MVFQGKLVVDGLRDVILSPISIVAALTDLAMPGDDRGRRFYAVVKFGRRTEGWINLFGAADRHEPDFDPQGIDAVVEELERLVRDPARREDVRERARHILQRLQKPQAE